MSAKELEVPVRLRNKSRHTVYGPITVRIDGFGNGMGELLQEFSPTIMNATNGKTKDGATFEYSHLKNLMGIDLTREPGGLEKEDKFGSRLKNYRNPGALGSPASCHPSSVIAIPCAWSAARTGS